MSTDFVPEGFTPPDGLVAEAFVLEPLGPQHNEADHAAWMSSIEHIHASPGFSDDFDDDPDPWPRPMSLEQNLSDLEQHAQDFQDRVGIHVHGARSRGSRRDRLRLPLSVAPRRRGRAARSWVRRSRAELDEPLRRAVRAWLGGPEWPFERIDYAAG